MSRKKKRHAQRAQRDAATLSDLIAQQLIDQRRDWLLTRSRPSSQKTTRHIDDAGESAAARQQRIDAAEEALLRAAKAAPAPTPRRRRP